MPFFRFDYNLAEYKVDDYPDVQKLNLITENKRRNIDRGKTIIDTKT